MSTSYLFLVCAKEEVCQGGGETIYDLPKNVIVGFLLLRGVLLLKNIACLKKLCIFLYFFVYVLFRR